MRIRPLSALAAATVASSIAACWLEPDQRRILPGAADPFSEPGAFRLRVREALTQENLLARLRDLHESGGDQPLLVSLDRDVAARMPLAVLLAHPQLLSAVSAAQEVVYAYPDGGDWLLEATHQRELRLYRRNPG